MLQLLEKTKMIKTGADLVNAVCLWVNNLILETTDTQNQTQNVAILHR